MAPFWETQSSEALCRTAIDLVLFDRLEAHQEAAAARQLSLRSESSIVAQCLEPNHVVSGDADYTLGYMQVSATKTQFESSMIVVEAKREITFGVGISQAAVYMSMYILTIFCVRVLNYL